MHLLSKMKTKTYVLWHMLFVKKSHTFGRFTGLFKTDMSTSIQRIKFVQELGEALEKGPCKGKQNRVSLNCIP